VVTHITGPPQPYAQQPYAQQPYAQQQYAQQPYAQPPPAMYPQQYVQPQMVGAVMQQRVVGQRLKPEAWCCVFALALVFWPAMCIPCCVPSCKEDVVETFYVMPVRDASQCCVAQCCVAPLLRRRPWHRIFSHACISCLVSLRAAADDGTAGCRHPAVAADGACSVAQTSDEHTQRSTDAQTKAFDTAILSASLMHRELPRHECCNWRMHHRACTQRFCLPRAAAHCC
jgi:hypothetical protein